MRCLLCNEHAPTCQCLDPQWASEHPWSPAHALQEQEAPVTFDTYTAATTIDLSLVHSGREKLTC